MPLRIEAAFLIWSVARCRTNDLEQSRFAFGVGKRTIRRLHYFEPSSKEVTPLTARVLRGLRLTVVRFRLSADASIIFERGVRTAIWCGEAGISPKVSVATADCSCTFADPSTAT